MGQVVTFNSLVGYQLLRRRKELNLDQATVSVESGISQPVLSRLEKGAASISIDQLFMVCKALKCSPSKVLQSVEVDLSKLDKSQQVEVKTTKEVDNSGALLAGAAIGTALAIILASK